jgi:hypothetical protein
MDYGLCINKFLNRFITNMDYGLCIMCKQIYYIKMDYVFNLISFIVNSNTYDQL